MDATSARPAAAGPTIDVERLKAQISIAAVAGAAVTLKRAGSRLKGLCPLHDEKTPSFFVDEPQGVWFCFGCGQGGDVIDLQCRLHSQSFLEACAELGAAVVHTSSRAKPAPRMARAEAISLAQTEWNRAVFVEGSLAERYLTCRGVGRGIPESIRFSRVPRFWRDDGTEGPRLPAMIAAAQDAEGRVVGIQRTFVDEAGRKSRRGEARLALGRMRGSALRLGPVQGEIMLATAVEDALSVRLMFPGASVWAVFGDANLPHVELPSLVRRVTLCGDADQSGRTAVAAAIEALRGRGLLVADLVPRAGCKDFNEEWLPLHA